MFVPKNVFPIVLTFGVLKLLRAIDINEVSPIKVESKLVTFRGSKLDKSKNLIFAQFKNILFIFSTRGTLKFVKSIDVNALTLPNIKLIFIT